MHKLEFVCKTNGYSSISSLTLIWMHAKDCNIYVRKNAKMEIFITNSTKYFMSFGKGAQMFIDGGAPPVMGNTQMTRQKYTFLQHRYKEINEKIL